MSRNERIYSQLPEVYERLYGEHRDYAMEVDFVEQQYRLNADTDGRRALVVGCGTGEHVPSLVERGFEVVALDRHRAMVRRARRKSEASFIVGALPDLPVSRSFDLVLAPYDVINYLPHDSLEEGLDALLAVLADGGVLVFDNESFVEVPDDITTEVVVGDDDTRYVRLSRMTVEDHQATLESVIVVDDGDLAVFDDRHLLAVFDDDRIAEFLAERGYAVERYEGGYGLSMPREKFDMTVFIVTD